MKHVIQVGLNFQAEYRFLAEVRSPYDKRANRFPNSRKNRMYPLPSGFDMSGDWMYHGIDCQKFCGVEYFTESDRVKFYHYAITDINGTTEVQDFLASKSGQADVRFDAPSLTIEGFCEAHDIERCELLVLDIEGWEGRVLASYTGRIPIDYIIVEYHEEYLDRYPFGVPEDKFNEIIVNKGFQVMCIHETNRGITREYCLRRREM